MAYIPNGHKKASEGPCPPSYTQPITAWDCYREWALSKNLLHKQVADRFMSYLIGKRLLKRAIIEYGNVLKEYTKR